MVLPTGIKRLALAAAGAPLVATMTIVMLAGPSSAASQPVKAAVVSHASSDHVFRTLKRGPHPKRSIGQDKLRAECS